MRVLVCGSRHFTDYQLLKETLESYDITEIISGHARGADSLAEVFATEKQIPKRIFPADWERYGKRAGPIRNAQMLREGLPDMVLAFLGPNSRGTKNMINQAEKAGVPVHIIQIGPRIQLEARGEV